MMEFDNLMLLPLVCAGTPSCPFVRLLPLSRLAALVLRVGYQCAGIGFFVWRGGTALLTLGFAASNLVFAGGLDVAYPCLLCAVVS